MKKTLLLYIFVAFFISSCVSINLPSQEVVEKTISGEGKAKILLVDISGTINDEKKTGFLGMTDEPRLTSRVRDELKRAEEDDAVKAVLLRIKSPGGLVTPSDIIHHEIKSFKERTGKPVAAHLMGVAASGGYYIAAGADTITAQPTTVTGSVGVIIFMLNASGLMEKIGISNETLKTGDVKDAGSPLREMTEEDREVLQTIIDSMFERFIGVVREGRPSMTDEAIDEVSGGSVYVADRALELGLIDSIGYLDDTVEELKRELGVDEARVVTYGRVGSYDENIYSRAPTGGAPSVNLINIDASSLTEALGVKFMYLWMPN